MHVREAGSEGRMQVVWHPLHYILPRHVPLRLGNHAPTSLPLLLRPHHDIQHHTIKLCSTHFSPNTFCTTGLLVSRGTLGDCTRNVSKMLKTRP